MKTLFDSDAVKRVARTFVYAFLGILVPGLLGWLGDLTDWARANGQAPLPDAHSLAYLGVAAIGAGFVAVLNALGIVVENATGVTPGRTVADTAMGETIEDEPDEPVGQVVLGQVGEHTEPVDAEDEPDEVPMPPTVLKRDVPPAVPMLDKADAEKMLKRELVAYVSGDDSGVE